MENGICWVMVHLSSMIYRITFTMYQKVEKFKYTQVYGYSVYFLRQAYTINLDYEWNEN